jgi:OPT oligopeptide transporter protein
MIFKAYSVQTLAASTGFVQDLKLGHYVKVPPRATFMGTSPSLCSICCQIHITELYLLVQMVATILAAFVQVGVKEWIFKNVEGICQKDQPSQLTCPHNQVFFTASAVWCVDY